MVCHGAREIIGSDHAILAVRDKSNGHTGYFTTSGIDTGLSTPELDKGILGNVFVHRRVEKLSGDNIDKIEAGLPDGYPPCSSLIAVPLTSLSENYGWLCLSNKLVSEKFRDNDEILLSILAAQTGRIYENGSLYVKMQQHATILERTQLHLRTQYEAGQILANADSYQEALPDLLKLIGENLGFTAARVWAINAKTESFE
jgi:transcriptional regulator with GAF, ATPase, and Fis domain